MQKIVVINGTGGSGKDTFVKMCDDILSKDGTDTFNFSSIDPTKVIAKQMGWSGAKNEKDRKFLHDIKSAWTEYNDGPNQMVCDLTQAIMAFPLDTVVFVHIRETSEIFKFTQKFRTAITLLIRRGDTNKFDNEADRLVENYGYDYVISNEGNLMALKKSAEDFVNILTRGK